MSNSIDFNTTYFIDSFNIKGKSPSAMDSNEGIQGAQEKYLNVMGKKKLSESCNFETTMEEQVNLKSVLLEQRVNKCKGNEVQFNNISSCKQRSQNQISSLSSQSSSSLVDINFEVDLLSCEIGNELLSSASTDSPFLINSTNQNQLTRRVCRQNKIKFQLNKEQNHQSQDCCENVENNNYQTCRQPIIVEQIFIRNTIFNQNALSMRNLIEFADTGDLLLFQNSGIIAKLQRSITLSQYDHVAMILRYENNQLFLLESTSQEGVALTSWDRFLKMKWYRQYQKMAYRKLNATRDEQFIKKIDQFSRTMKGKKYNLNFKKLFNMQTIEGKESFIFNDNQPIHELQTYFCSELIAATYKSCGLLDPQLSSSQYWPVHFTTRKQLQMLKGASLGIEHIIYQSNS